MIVDTFRNPTPQEKVVSQILVDEATDLGFPLHHLTAAYQIPKKHHINGVDVQYVVTFALPEFNIGFDIQYPYDAHHAPGIEEHQTRRMHFLIEHGWRIFTLKSCLVDEMPDSVRNLARQTFSRLKRDYL